MNTFGSEESGTTNPASVGATTVLEEMMKIPGDTIRDEIKVTENISYYSNVEESFLKYANLLETINEDAVRPNLIVTNFQERNYILVTVFWKLHPLSYQITKRFKMRTVQKKILHVSLSFL